MFDKLLFANNWFLHPQYIYDWWYTDKRFYWYSDKPLIYTDNRYQSDIISTFWFLIMRIFSIIMSIIKAINDAIITRNDIIGAFFYNIGYIFQKKPIPIMTNINYRFNYHCVTNLYVHVEFLPLEYHLM